MKTELFPGFIYRMVKPGTVLLTFVFRKVVLTGAKEQSESYESFKNIYSIQKVLKTLSISFNILQYTGLSIHISPTRKQLDSVSSHPETAGWEEDKLGTSLICQEGGWWLCHLRPLETREPLGRL